MGARRVQANVEGQLHVDSGMKLPHSDVENQEEPAGLRGQLRRKKNDEGDRRAGGSRRGTAPNEQLETS